MLLGELKCVFYNNLIFKLDYGFYFMTIEVVNSLEDALSLLGNPCTTCEPLGWPGFWKGFKVEENNLIYQCSFGPHPSEAVPYQAISVSDENILEVVEELKRYTSEFREKKFDYRDFEKGRDVILDRLKSMAGFFEEGRIVNAEGPCFYCGDEVPINIKRKNILYSCSPCASIVADSHD